MNDTPSYPNDNGFYLVQLQGRQPNFDIFFYRKDDKLWVSVPGAVPSDEIVIGWRKLDSIEMNPYPQE